MQGGGLMTAGATAVAAAAFACAAWTTHRRADGPMTRSLAIPAFFAIVACFLGLAGARQCVALDPALARWDRRLFLLSVVPAGYSVLPLVHLALRSLDWPWRRRRHAVIAFAVAVTVGLLFLFTGGIEGPQRTAWGSEWRILSPVTQVLILLAVSLPGIAFSLLLLLAAQRLEGPDKRRLFLVGTACLLYWTVFTLDAFAAPGPWLALERLVTAGAAVIALLAYRPLDAVHLAGLERAQARRIRELV